MAPLSIQARGRLSEQNPLSRPVFMAPMEGFTDRVFRTIIAEIGAPDYAVTDFIRVTAEGFTERGFKKCLANVGPIDDRLIVQLMGNSPETLARACRSVEEMGCSWIDLNVGCPSRKVRNHLAGSALLADIPHLGRIVQAMRRCTRARLSLKIRLGVDSTLPFTDVLNCAVDAGADAIFIHGRTVADAYRVPAQWQYIKKAVETIALPIIGNGDIRSIDGIATHIRNTNCEGTMVGRAILGNPWFFKQLDQSRRGIAVTPPTRQQVVEFFALLHERYQNIGLQPRQSLCRLKAFAVQHFVSGVFEPERKKQFLQATTAEAFRHALIAWRDVH